MPTFDSTDLNNAVSESRVVHESVANTDHNDASNLKQGYSIENPYNASNLVVYWPFHENSSSVAYDFSGNNGDASVNSVNQGVSGLLGTTAYDFDGSSSGVIGTSGYSTWNSDFTYVGWFNPDILGSADSPGGIGDGGTTNYIDLRGDGNGNLEGYIDNTGDVFPSVPVSTGEWQQFGLRRSGDDWQIFVDDSWGNVLTANPSIYTDNLYAGRQPYDGYSDRHFDGKMAYMRLYNYALSAGELDDLRQIVTSSGALTTQFTAV